MNKPEISDLSKNTWTPQHYRIIKHVCSQTNLNEIQANRALVHYKGDYKKAISLTKSISSVKAARISF